MGKIGRELVRIAQERVIMIERAIDARDWHPNDPMRAQLERDLAEARSSLAHKSKMANDEETLK